MISSTSLNGYLLFFYIPHLCPHFSYNRLNFCLFPHPIQFNSNQILFRTTGQQQRCSSSTYKLLFKTLKKIIPNYAWTNKNFNNEIFFCLFGTIIVNGFGRNHLDRNYLTTNEVLAIDVTT